MTISQRPTPVVFDQSRRTTGACKPTNQCKITYACMAKSVLRMHVCCRSVLIAILLCLAFYTILDTAGANALAQGPVASDTSSNSSAAASRQSKESTPAPAQKYSQVQLESTTQNLASWPEFLGAPVSTAKLAIARAGYEPEILPEGTIVPLDYQSKRVYIYYNQSKQVSLVPCQG